METSTKLFVLQTFGSVRGAFAPTVSLYSVRSEALAVGELQTTSLAFVGTGERHDRATN